jgi:hypothetical protein
MATWNEQRQRRVIGEQAGPLQDEVMQGFNDQGFGGALAVQDGRVAGGNVGSRMPEDNIPRNRARVVYGEGNPLLPGSSVEGIGRAAAVPTPEAGTMSDFLNPSMAAGRAESAMTSMRAPMSPGRRAIYDDREQRAETVKQSDFDRNLKLIQATPVAFGNAGGMLGDKYFGPTPEQPVTKLGPDESALVGDRMFTAPASSRVILNDNQLMIQGPDIQNTVSNRGPVQDKQVISPDGTALWNGQEWIQNPYVKRSTENQLYAPPSGIPESFTMNGLDYVWNPKIGDFDRKAGRITESDQSMGEMKNTQRSGTSLQGLNADQVSAYNAWVQQRYGNGGTQSSVQPAPQATPDPNNPAAKWLVK